MIHALALFSIVLGEVLIIYSEMMGARLYLGGATLSSALVAAVPVGLVGAFLLTFGYTLGLKAFQNIWIVSAFSIGSILMVEPFFNYFYIGELPTLGAGVGFLFGVLGILATFLL